MEKLKRGDAVKVRLSPKHTLDGDMVEHDAKFVRLHPDGEWADVELDRHHSIDESSGQKIHRLSVPVAQFVAVLLLLCLLAIPASAQDLGNVGLRTVNSVVANGTTCTGSPQLFTTAQHINTFDNLGQTSHLATATSTASTFTMEIDGIDNIGNVFRLSDVQVGTPTSAKGGLVVTAAGYMPIIQISVTCTAAATFSVSYSGSFSPQPPNIAGALLVATDKFPFQSAPANATTSTTFQSPSGNSAGTIIFQFTAAGPAGSSITAQCLSNSSQNLQSFTFPLATTTAAQLFQVTQSTCPFVTLTYTSGGASATTYTLEYVFNQTGTQQTLSTANVGPSASPPISIVSDSLSQAFFGSVISTNPTGPVGLVFLSANSGTRTAYVSDMLISCTAQCSFTLFEVTTVGTGCTTITSTNEKVGSSVTPTASMLATCTAFPTQVGANITRLDIPANTPFVFDTKGMILPGGTNAGLAVNLLASVTGNVTIAYRWYER